MSGLGTMIARMPRSAQVAALAAIAVLLAIAAGLFGGLAAAVTVLLGAAAVGGLVYAYRSFLLRRDEKQASPFAGLLAGSAAGPTRIAEPARRARLDELRRSFETGLEKFRAAGKSLYSVPWYVLIGEPGSGKTEAVRHCGVGFPPGLQDELQGAGGTLNMSWWFTNQAVILDTAGRLLFEEVEPGSTSEWQEFLKLLKRSRPTCPVNGLLVVIPADSLIKDPDDVIDSKAARLAGQLDVIQKLLGVRFPAYVVITKSDLVNGFREFFDRADDPRAANQILGWSNPAALDAPFRPTLVDEHLHAVEQRLIRRRLGLLIDPVHTEDPRKPRLDQVDALYAFPESLSRLAPRLRRYLERMFVAGEWSARPLFLRGIYFTSALREGAALDADLAAALDVSPDKLPEGRIWERERALFLKDLFLNKVFREKGLVTRAADTASLLRARAAALLGVSAVGLAVIALLTWLGARGLQKAAVEPAQFWAAVASAVEAGKAPSVEPGRPPYRLPIVSKAIVSDEDFKYRGDAGPDASLLRSLPVDADSRRIGAIHTVIHQRATERIAVPVVFYPAAIITGDVSASLLAGDRRAAGRSMFEVSVLRPLTEAAVARLQADAAADHPWTTESTLALEQIIRVEAARSGAARSLGGVASPILLDPLLRFALAGNEGYLLEGASDDARELQRISDALYSGDSAASWPPKSMAIDRAGFIAACVDRFAGTIDRAAQSAAGPAGRLIDALEAFAAAEQRLFDKLTTQPPAQPEDWLAEIEPIRNAASRASALLPALAGRRLDQAAIQDAAAESARLRDDAQRILDLLNAAGASSPALAQSGNALRAAVQAASSRRVNLDAVSARAAALADAHLGRGIEPLFAARLGVYESLATLAESADEPVDALAIGDGAPLLIDVDQAVAHTRQAADAALRGSVQPQDPRLKAILAAIDAAASARRAAIAAAYTVNGTVDEQTLLAAASRLAAQLPVENSAPALPLGRANAAIDRAIEPDAALPVLREVLAACSAAPAGSAIARSGPAAATAFLLRYAAAWSDGVSASLAPEDQRTWQQFQQGLAATGGAASIREAVAAHARRQAAASEALGRSIAVTQLSPEARQAVERLARVAGASNAAAQSPMLDAAYDRVLSSWKSLGADSAEARRRLLAAIAEPSGPQDYLVVSLADPRESDLLARWWRSFVLAAIRTLARDAQASSPGQTGSRFARFPLGKLDAAAGQLTPEEAVAARASVAGVPAVDPGITANVRDAEIASALQALAQPGAGGSAGGLNAAMLAILPERAGQRFACTAEIPPDPALPAFAAIRIRQLGAETRTVLATAGAAVDIGRVDYPGASIQVEFLPTDSADAQPIATATIPGPWLGLWLIASQRGRPVEATDRRFWETLLPVETAAGPRSARIRLRFADRELPGPEQWPR